LTSDLTPIQIAGITIGAIIFGACVVGIGMFILKKRGTQRYENVSVLDIQLKDGSRDLEPTDELYLQ